jgi:predicted NBD/HSP70 family sugar kinase
VGLAALLDMVAEPGEPARDERIDLGARLGHLTDRAAAGDARVLDALADQARWLGIGISILANILNPDTIVLGGHYPALRKYLEEPLIAELRARVLAANAGMFRVKFSELGFEAASLGAAHAGIEQLIDDPTLARIRASARS